MTPWQKTEIFSPDNMVHPSMRHLVSQPREYGQICTDKGKEYYDYGSFSLEPNINPENYRLQKFVGRGTFARCYRSKCIGDMNDRPNLCIKILKRTKEKHYVKLRRELSILTKLQGQPGVIRYHGLLKDRSCILWRDIPEEYNRVEEQDDELMKLQSDYNTNTDRSRDRAALVFDIVEDTPWKEALKFISNDLLSYLLFQIALCLDNAHSHGIMHRDIKPPNCLLDLNNKKVIVIDWGQAEYFIPYFKHNVQVGGRSFKAPELVIGGNVVRGLHDYSVDVWAFGVMMASMIYFGGTKNLFWADNREGVIESIAKLLGTVDLYAYLRERPYIEKSEITIDLMADEGYDRQSPFIDSNFVKANYKQSAEEDVEKWRRRHTPEALGLIEKILQYNPQDRPTFRDMMVKDPYFENTRIRLKNEEGIVFDSKNIYSETNDEAIRMCRKLFT